MVRILTFRNGLTVIHYKKIMSSYATLNTSWISVFG
nr:MAG TPA: hypothetical protein [Bacteriophage sp.]